MKKAIIVLTILLFIGCKTKNSIINSTESPVAKVEKIATNQVSDIQKAKAYELGKRVLMTCNTSKFKPFDTTEATESVINNTTEETLSKTCTRFRQYYGSFIDLELIEAYKNNIDQSITFRYKASYSKKVANKELRVIMNSDNKVSSIKSMDWKDTFPLN